MAQIIAWFTDARRRLVLLSQPAATATTRIAQRSGMYCIVTEQAWLFRHSNAHNAVPVAIVRTRETWWVRDPSRRVGIARDRREKGTQRD